MPQTDTQRRQIIILFGQRLNSPAEQKLRVGYFNEVLTFHSGLLGNI